MMILALMKLGFSLYEVKKLPENEAEIILDAARELNKPPAKDGEEEETMYVINPD